jgi:hypothetical protein
LVGDERIEHDAGHVHYTECMNKTRMRCTRKNVFYESCLLDSAKSLELETINDVLFDLRKRNCVVQGVAHFSGQFECFRLFGITSHRLCPRITPVLMDTARHKGSDVKNQATGQGLFCTCLKV